MANDRYIVLRQDGDGVSPVGRIARRMSAEQAQRRADQLTRACRGQQQFHIFEDRGAAVLAETVAVPMLEDDEPDGEMPASYGVVAPSNVTRLR
jgi:hypothetical protein